MAISEAAQRNHHAMFPDHHSTLKVTDPEFVELFDNWAFDEVMSDAPLDPRTLTSAWRRCSTSFTPPMKY